MKASFKFDATKFRGAVRELAQFAKKKPVQDVMKQAAAQVIRTIVSITPPAKGSADAAAKARGEAVITADLGKIALAVAGLSKKKAGSLFTDAAGLLAAHERARVGASGRVNPRSRKDKLLVAQGEYNATLAKLLKLVGTLAAGWNAAAEGLGVRLPAWIRRHGNSHGIIRITVTATGIRIYFANSVKFVDHIKDLERRLQWSLDTVAKSILERQIPALVKRLGKKAGFKAR